MMNKNAKLLAAFAVLAVALAAFAVIPAVAEDSDVAGTGADAGTSTSEPITTAENLSKVLKDTETENIKLGANLTLTTSLDVGAKDKVVDLNGYTLTITGDKLQYLVKNTNALEFKNGTLVAKLTDQATNSLNESVDTTAFYPSAKLSFNTLTLNVTVSDDKGFGIYSASTADKSFIKVNGFITAGNRAIHMGSSETLTLQECGSKDAPFVLSGHEKAIQAKTCTNGVNIVKSYIDLKLLDTGAVNGGADDAFALKTTKLIVDADSVLNTEGLHILGSGSEINGTVNVVYSALNKREADGSKTEIPGGFIAFSESNDNPNVAQTVTIENNGELRIDAKCAIAGTIAGSKTGSTPGSISFGKVTAGALEDCATLGSDATFTAGSIKINGAEVSGPYIEVTGNVTIEGDLEAGETLDIKDGATVTVLAGSKLTIKAGAEAKTNTSGAIVVNGTLEVAEAVTGTTPAAAAKITGAGAITINEKGKMNVGGTVGTSGAVTNNGTIFITNEDASIPANVGGTGSVDTSSVESEGTISGDWKTTTVYGPNQTVTLTGDTTLVAGTVIVIQGKLVIPEGMTLTIEKGAQLIVYKSTAKLINDGTIVVESTTGNISSTSIPVTERPHSGSSMTTPGGLVVVYAEVTNNGTILADADALANAAAYGQKSTIFFDGTVKNNGTITVGEDSKAVFDGTIENKGTMELYGKNYLNDGVVINNSAVIMVDGTIESTGIITNAAIGAEVQIVTMKSVGILTVNDSGIKTVANKKIYVNEADNSVKITSKAEYTVEGLVIKSTEKKADTETDSRNYYKMLDMSGSVSSSDERVNPEGDRPNDSRVSIASVGFGNVTGELSIGQYVDMTVADAGDTKKLGFVIDGTVTVVEDGTFGFATASGSNSLTVLGKLTLETDDVKNETGNTINAAYYDVAKTTTTKKLHVYTTLATAVADGAKKIELTGSNSVEANLVIPAGVTVDNKGTLTVKEEAKLDFATGSVLKNTSTIKVEGVLYIEDLKGTKAPGEITSDVIINGTADRTYCGVEYALSIAKEGDTVKLSTTPVSIDSDVTIPVGVTLDTNEMNIMIENNVTVTIDGTLYINDSTITVASIETAGVDVQGKVVLNGTIKSKDVAIPYGGTNQLKVAGAYYEISEGAVTYYYAEPVATAAPKIATADEGKMTLKGVLKVGDVTFAGTADKAVTVFITDKVTAGSITLDYATIDFSNKEFVGTITDGVGTVIIAGMPAADFKIVSALNSDDVKTMTVSGAFSGYSDDDKTTVMTIAGDVSLGAANIDFMTVDGKLVVSDTATVDEMVVNGTVTVDNAKTLSSGSIEVYGTLTTVDKTTELVAGKVNVVNLYVGISMEDTTGVAIGAAASVSGNIVITDLAIVADGSTINNEIVKDKPFTAFFIEGKAYATAYDFTIDNTNKIDDVEYTVPNARSNGWTSEDGDIEDEVIGDYEKVDAKVKYDVYVIVIFADAGAEDITIDGNLLRAYTVGSVAVSGYEGVVAAGEHKVEYKLANGYTGTAKLSVYGMSESTADVSVNGLNFNVSGGEVDTGNAVAYFQLTGIEKSGYVPDSPDTDNGMTVTDYLLIVLVVLIVVMAIIVAMRMMRS